MGPVGQGPKGSSQPSQPSPSQPAALGPLAHGAHGANGTHKVIQMGPGQTGPGQIDSQMALVLPIASFRSNLIAIELAICRGL